jgi:hypothetical protein
VAVAEDGSVRGLPEAAHGSALTCDLRAPAGAQYRDAQMAPTTIADPPPYLALLPAGNRSSCQPVVSRQEYILGVARALIPVRAATCLY